MIKVVDDGKGTQQSWNATIADCEWNPTSDYQLNVVGYGSSREESIFNLKTQAKSIIEFLTEEKNSVL